MATAAEKDLRKRIRGIPFVQSILGIPPDVDMSLVSLACDSRIAPGEDAIRNPPSFYVVRCRINMTSVFRLEPLANMIPKPLHTGLASQHSEMVAMHDAASTTLVVPDHARTGASHTWIYSIDRTYQVLDLPLAI